MTDVMKILIMGGTRFIGVFLSRLLVKEGHQVTLFTRGKASIAQQLPGESEKDYADFSSKDIEFVKTSLSAEGFDVVYDINGIDMACDTFLKIVQKYKRKFVIVQIGESEPFVSELLTSLLTTIELIDVEGDGMADMIFRCIQEMDINNGMMV
ncbi:unnamed protein product [Camellia sinensis]